MKDFELEFSRPFDVSLVTSTGIKKTIAATKEECLALAQRFSLLTLDRLEASLRLVRRARDLIEVRGHLIASLEQACVVSLEPVHSNIDTEFVRLFSEDSVKEEKDVTLDIEKEDVDEILDGSIDLGEMVAEELALSIDPYPRKPGAAFLG